jgi:hypothetical protein
MLPTDSIPPDLLARSRILEELGIQDRAWPLEVVLPVLQALDGAAVAVLGGDLYDCRNGKAAPMYESWHSDRESWESFREYADRSLREAQEYVRRYPGQGGRQIWVGLVLAVEPD